MQPINENTYCRKTKTPTVEKSNFMVDLKLSQRSISTQNFPKAPVNKIHPVFTFRKSCFIHQYSKHTVLSTKIPDKTVSSTNNIDSRF